MIKGRIKVNKTIKEIEFKMLREKDDCYIKIEPVSRIFKPSTLYFSLNHVIHNWDIYDKNKTEACFVYFKGSFCKPSFYLKTDDESYKIIFEYDEINVKSILKKHDINDFINKNCNLNSENAKCWGEAIFYSKRPDKPPFDEM